MRGLGRDLWAIVTYVVLLAVSLGLILFGVQHAQETPASADAGAAVAAGEGMELLAAGIVCAVFVAATAPVAILLSLGRASQAKALHDLRESVRLHGDTLLRIQEHTGLSDSAKRIAYRRDERAMLRRAIEEDIAHEDWQAALVLVNDMGERFGYREEAEEFRAHIEYSRAEVLDRRINEALDHFQRILDTHNWTAAYAEAARLQRLFPESHRVKDLDHRVRQAWELRKATLEREFLESAQRADVDHAMRVLKELDLYLTPREAEPFREVARGVVGKARENLGLQFKMAVQDHDWPTAVRVGEAIMQEFPNTTMAHEVRGRIDVLRAKAAQAAGLSNALAAS